MKRITLTLITFIIIGLWSAEGQGQVTTKEVVSSTSDPSTCAVGKLYINTTAPGKVWARVGGVCTRVDGVGAGAGTVTSVSVTTANGISGTVATATTTPAISLDISGLNAAKIGGGGVSTAEFDFLSTVTSNVQTQIDSKAPSAGPTFTGTVTIPTPFTLGAVSVLPTGTELNFVDGVTSAIQTQLDAKAALASPTFTGTPTLPTGTIATTQSAGNSTTAVATTAFVTTADNLKANLAGPTFTGTVIIPTPFTLGAVSVTSTGTQLNYLGSATGTTGTASTNLVFSTSPTLVTPVLGVATGTSLNLSGSALPAWLSSLTPLMMGGNGFFSSTTAQAAGGEFLFSQNIFKDGASNWKYVSTDEGILTVLGNGDYVIYTAPSGTAGNTATLTSRFSISNTGPITLSSGVTNSAGTPGSICYNTSTFEMTKNNALTCTVSAREYKSGIESLGKSGLATLLRMRPRQFAYKDNPTRLRWGFIADELQAIDPRLGDGYDAKGDAKSIDLAAILAINTKAIQELRAIVAAQAIEIAELKAQVKP